MDFSSYAIMYYTVFEDNNGALGLATSLRKNPKTRHNAVKFHFLREKVCEGKDIMTRRVEYKYQKASVFTKGLSAEAFHYIRKLLVVWLLWLFESKVEREKY